MNGPIPTLLRPDGLGNPAILQHRSFGGRLGSSHGWSLRPPGIQERPNATAESRQRECLGLTVPLQLPPTGLLSNSSRTAQPPGRQGRRTSLRGGPSGAEAKGRRGPAPHRRRSRDLMLVEQSATRSRVRGYTGTAGPGPNVGPRGGIAVRHMVVVSAVLVAVMVLAGSLAGCSPQQEGKSKGPTSGSGSVQPE
jgi:hypothetical protein